MWEILEIKAHETSFKGTFSIDIIETKRTSTVCENQDKDEWKGMFLACSIIFNVSFSSPRNSFMV